MSFELTRRVWKSSLSPHLKLVALYIASLADDNGNKIYPTIKRIAQRVGKSERVVQRAMSSLRKAGIIRKVAHQNGGKSLHVIYRFDVTKLPFQPGDSLQESAGETLQFTAGAAVERVSPTSPFGAERVTPTSGNEKRKSETSDGGSVDYNGVTSPHKLDVVSNKLDVTRAREMETGPRQWEEQDLSPEMEVQYWLKKTWMERNAQMSVRFKFPNSALGNLIAAEQAMGMKQFRQTWLQFMGMKSDKVYWLLKTLRQNGWKAPNPDFFVDRAPTSSGKPRGSFGNKPRRKTADEIFEIAQRRRRGGN